MDKRIKKYLHIFHIIATLILLSLTGCKANYQENMEKKMIQKNTKEILFEMILTYPDLKQYYHRTLKNRVPIVVKINDNLDSKMNITMFNVPVQFTRTVENLPKDTPFFEVQLFQIKDNETIFNITYDIEGILIKGKLIKEKNSWGFKEYNIIER